MARALHSIRGRKQLVYFSEGFDSRLMLGKAPGSSELEQEMAHLRTISDDIATLQWRLRRSLNERESNISTLRARASTS